MPASSLRPIVLWLAFLLVPGALRGAEESVWTGESFGGERHIFERPGGRAFLVLPANVAAERATPWVWYAPAIKGYPTAKLNWLFSRLVAAGVAVAGIDVGETYANPESRARFWEFFQEVRARHRLAPQVCLLAQSRGGLNHYNFAADHPEAVRCIAGIYPVMDLRSYPGLAKAAPAYGRSEAELAAELGQHNPVDRITAVVTKGIPILHLHGDHDTLVPLEANSGAALERARAAGGAMQLITVAGRGHQEVAEFFQSEELLQFLLRFARPE